MNFHERLADIRAGMTSTLDLLVACMTARISSRSPIR